MGEAKRRGTFEDRKAQAIQREQEYGTLLKLTKRSGWRTPHSFDTLPKHSWVNFWRQMIKYERNPEAGRPVVPHRTGSGYR